MSEKLESKEFEFDEFIEEKETLLGNVSHIKEIPICRQPLIVLPYEWMHLEISDPNIQQMLTDVEKRESLFGIIEKSADEVALPAVGTIGVAADIEEITKTGYANLQLVKIQGIVRFTIDEYVETDEPYPVARITFFEDNENTTNFEKVNLPVLGNRLRKLMKELCRLEGKYRHLDDYADTIKDEDLQSYSFFFWFIFLPPAQLRKLLIEMDSTVQRLFVLTRHIERVIQRLKGNKPTRFN